MHRKEEFFRDMLSEAIRGATDEVVQKHWPRPTQEHQLTSRIAQSIEGRLDGMDILGRKISVLVQEMPDRGPNTLEKSTGVDLYIGLKVESGSANLEKGLFVQAKWDQPLPPTEMGRLVGQCERMVHKSKVGSFVWVYGAGGTAVIPATEVLAHPQTNPSQLSSHDVGKLFRNVMDCVSGDKELIMPGIFYEPKALERMLFEFGAQIAVSISARPHPKS